MPVRHAAEEFGRFTPTKFDVGSADFAANDKVYLKRDKAGRDSSGNDTFKVKEYPVKPDVMKAKEPVMEERTVKAIKPDRKLYLNMHPTLTKYGLTQVHERVAEKTGRARTVTEANGHTLLMNKEACVGPLHEEIHTEAKECGSVTPRRRVGGCFWRQAPACGQRPACQNEPCGVD